MNAIGTAVPGRTGHRRVAPAAAAWAALLVLGGSAGCDGGDADPAAADVTATTEKEGERTTEQKRYRPFEDEGERTAPEEVATLFLEAYIAHDADEAAAFLTGAGFDAFGGSAETLRLETEFRMATGVEYQFRPCHYVDMAGRVRCPYDFHGIRSEDLRLGPYGDNHMEFTVADGSIVASSDHIAFRSNGFSSEVWEPFAAWVSTDYPEDAAVMYTDDSRTLPRLSPESIELWEQRSREYVEKEVATQFLDAYTGYDADGAAALLTGAGLDEFGGTAEALRLETEFRIATGVEHQFGPCQREYLLPGASTLRCPYDLHAIRSEEMGLGPYGDNHIDLTIADGLIIAVEDHIAFMTNGFSEEVWEPFAAWVSTAHPEDAATMYTDESRTLQRLSPESIDLWEQHSREYVEEVGG